MKNLAFIGYFEKPFDFCYVTDRMLIESMQETGRKDRFSFTDWNDVYKDLSCKETFVLDRMKYIQSNLRDSDAVIILETPTKTSTHVSLKKVFPILQRMEKLSIPGINSAETFVKFPDKSYLFNYSQLPFPKTFYVDENSDLERILLNLGGEVILKPTDTDGGYGVTLLPNDIVVVRENIQKRAEDSPFLIQEYLSEIMEGERSLFFFNKEFKYAMLKKPREGEFRSNEDCIESLTKYEPTEEEIKIARNALLTMNTPSVLERVDMSSLGKIIEMTLDCPGLYLVEAGVQKQIGNWFYEMVDAVSHKNT